MDILILMFIKESCGGVHRSEFLKTLIRFVYAFNICMRFISFNNDVSYCHALPVAYHCLGVPSSHIHCLCHAIAVLYVQILPAKLGLAATCCY